jgi:hypothetical protein
MVPPLLDLSPCLLRISTSVVPQQLPACLIAVHHWFGVDQANLNSTLGHTQCHIFNLRQHRDETLVQSTLAAAVWDRTRPDNVSTKEEQRGCQQLRCYAQCAPRIGFCCEQPHCTGHPGRMAP